MIRPSARCTKTGWLVAVAALIAMTPATGWSQTVRLFAGSRAELVGANQFVVLGRSERKMPGVVVTNPTGPVTSICCQWKPGLNCVTDRDVGLQAPRQYVLSRYGASRFFGSPPNVLMYPGIQFSFDGNDRVNIICVVPAGR